MRKLSEIIEDVVAGEMPSPEECYWALKAYRFMRNMDHRMLREELLAEERQSSFARKEKARLSFDMYKGALAKSPVEWCGGQVADKEIGKEF